MSRELWWKPLHFISSRCVHRQLFKGLAQASSGQPAAHSAFPCLIQKNTAAKILYQAAAGTHSCRWDGQFPLIQGSGLGKSLSWDRSVGFCEAWELEHRPEHVRKTLGRIQAQPLPSVLLSSPGKGRAKDKAQMGCLSVLHLVAAAIVVVWRTQKGHIAETLGQKIKMEPLFCLWKKHATLGRKLQIPICATGNACYMETPILTPSGQKTGLLHVLLPLQKQSNFIQIEKTFAPPLSRVKNEPHLMADLPNNGSFHRNIPALSAHSCCLLRIITCVLKGKLVEVVQPTWWNSRKYNKTEWMYINHEWGLWLEAKMSIFVLKTGWVVSALEKIGC